MTRLPIPAMAVDDRLVRLAEIERVLKFDPRHPDRRKLVSEYLDLTEPENNHVTERA